MRQKLNENPKYQLAMVGILIVVGGYMLFGRGSGSATTTPPATAPATTTLPTDPAASTTTLTGAPVDPAAAGAVAPPVPTPPLPPRVLAAYDHGDTVALLIVRGGGVDDQLVAGAVRRVATDPGVAPFVVSANDIARYAAITQGAGVDRVPALVILHPSDGAGGPAEASVQYGFQSAASIVQAIRDAAYHGRIVEYAPG